MLGVFQSVSKLFHLESVNTDNTVFRLHYKITVIILVVGSILVTSRQYIGDPIDCLAQDVPSEYINSYCWIHSTYTVENKGKNNTGPYPGVNAARNQTGKYHRYYQWVCFMLFFQAITFYIPKFLWNLWEGGRCRSIVMDLTSPMIDEETVNTRKSSILTYLRNNFGQHNSYAYKFFFCELLNLVNIITQIFFTNYFLDYQFITYGLKVIEATNSENSQLSDLLSTVFPIMTKCQFKKFGISGTTENLDGLCILSLNIINEKIYLFLWFWFLVLTIITVLFAIHRLVTLFVPRVRCYLLKNSAGMSNYEDVDFIERYGRIGDWFLLLQVAKSMEHSVFREIVHELVESFDRESEENTREAKRNFTTKCL